MTSRRRSALASATSATSASTPMTAAGRPSASASGWNWTGTLVPVNADRSMDEPTTCGSARAQASPRHDRGEHGRHGLGDDQAGRPLVAHDGEPGQGQLALRRPERQAEDHDEQAERGGGRDGRA